MVVVVVVVVVFKLIHIGFTHLVAVDFKISKRGQYVKTQKYCLCLFIYFFCNVLLITLPTYINKHYVTHERSAPKQLALG